MFTIEDATRKSCAFYSHQEWVQRVERDINEQAGKGYFYAILEDMAYPELTITETRNGFVHFLKFFGYNVVDDPSHGLMRVSWSLNNK